MTLAALPRFLLRPTVMARILLVDDEKMARAVYGDYLSSGGHQVTAVSSLSEAKVALEAERFDCVVTDLILPEGDGMQVLQHIKDRFPDVEVVVITALDKVDPAVRAIKSGAAEYLVKPVTPDALSHAVARALMTRQLLRENETLRAHVALLETGQRIATTLDRERLISTAVGAFQQAAGADAVLVYVRNGAEQSLEGKTGIDGDELLAVRQSLESRLWPWVTSGDARGQEVPLEAIPAPYETAFAVPASEGDSVLGCAVLLFKGDIPSESVQAASYLARHFGLGLRNLGRFAEVEDLAYLDDLTHLFNMRYMDLVLEREVQTAQQQNKPFSLLFLDLDYFKSVNDTHGHMVGSKLLVEVSRIIKGCVRDNDVVARFGGDEYVVLLRGTDSGGALKVGERIRRTIETHHFLAREGYGLSITTCIGVASFPEHAQDKAQLLDLADRAMYRGKKGTRNVIYMAAKGLEAPPPQRHASREG